MTSPCPSSRPLLSAVNAWLFTPKFFWALAIPVIFGDALLTALIVKYVPYTEIDWQTYMIQTEVYLKGERNYSKITGPTGPLVYPAGHVHIHRVLHEITESGSNIYVAQHIYGMLYLVSLVLSCAIYHRAGNFPNWVVLLLPFSKRLHSIFTLRLFNDCWAVVGVQAAILAYQYGLNDFGTLLFSAALSVKMSIILYLPGLLVILFKRLGLVYTFVHLSIIAATQVLFAMAFLKEDPMAYARSAFDLGRVFMYKWTVNWKFVDENYFLHPQWATSLLLGHVLVLISFGLFRWCTLDHGVWKLLKRGLARPLLPPGLSQTSPDYIATVLLTSNLIGIVFARSLHYQFYSWYAQQIPFLLWRTRYPTLFKLAIVFSIEYAWNVFPATPLSSAILFCANTMLLIGVWLGYTNGKNVLKLVM